MISVRILFIGTLSVADIEVGVRRVLLPEARGRTGISAAHIQVGASLFRTVLDPVPGSATSSTS